MDDEESQTNLDQGLPGKDKPDEGTPRKNPAAVELGRLGGLKGGKASAASMTPEQRRNRARKAALARWAKKKKKANPK